MEILELIKKLEKMQDRGDIRLYNIAIKDWSEILNTIKTEVILLQNKVNKDWLEVAKMIK